MISILLIFLIIFSGKILGFHKGKQLDIIKAIGIVFLETIIASISFLGMNLIIKFDVLYSILIKDINSLFLVILFFAIVNGYILYWINRRVFKIFNISKEIQTLCEYIIQWSLIYFTIYQIVFDDIIKNISHKDIVKKMLITNIVSPSELLFLVLPSLISIWISIITYKHYNNIL